MSSEGTHRTSSYQREKQQSAEYFHNVKLQKQNKNNKEPDQKDPSELEIRLCPQGELCALPGCTSSAQPLRDRKVEWTLLETPGQRTPSMWRSWLHAQADLHRAWFVSEEWTE